MNLVILDADVIINFLELGIWDKFVKNNNVILSESVINDEVRYFYAEDNPYEKVYIDLNKYLEEGEIKSVSLTALELVEFEKLRKKRKAPELDLGEKEILAATFLDKIPQDTKICIAETLAIRCAVFLDLKGRCISAENALIECGLQRNLKKQFSEKWFRAIVKKAERDKIMQQ